MSPWYALIESKYRWQYSAAILFTAGCVGAMMMIAYVWPQNVARIWFYAGLAGTLYCLARAYLDWRRVDDSSPRAAPGQKNSASQPPRDRP